MCATETDFLCALELLQIAYEVSYMLVSTCSHSLAGFEELQRMECCVDCRTRHVMSSLN